jgi:hypothetical protein
MRIIKIIFFLILTLLIQTKVTATDQVPDYLYYQDEKLTLRTGWGHPSPLQTYYTQNNIDYPFTPFSTANYRGHVAVWEIANDKFYLKEIQIEENIYLPKTYGVKSQSDSLSIKEEVFADWFSGVVVGEQRNKDNYWEVEKTYYFHIRYGVIVDVQELTEKDYKNISEIDSLDDELMAKQSMLELNSNYIAYYYRLHGNDTITFDTKGGYLKDNSGLSPILSYFSNDHMRWPFNWENLEKSGAPFCTWNIENDSLFLTKLELHTGTGFNSIDKHTVELAELFPEKTKNDNVFGNWISGAFIVHHGKNVEDEEIAGYYKFKASRYTCMRIDEGIVLEKHTVAVDFNFRNIPNDTDEGLKNIINEIYK